MGKVVNNPPRAKPVSREELLTEFNHIFESLPLPSMEGENAPVNVFGMMLNSPNIAKEFFSYWTGTKPHFHISIREQELIILRMACYYGCEYVWGHHVLIALKNGITQTEIDQIPFTPEDQKWLEKEKILLIAVDKILTKAGLDEEKWELLTKYWSTQEIIDILVVISQYVLVVNVNNLFGIKLEHDDIPRLPNV